MLVIRWWVSRALVISDKMLYWYNFHGLRTFWHSSCRVSAHLCSRWRLRICVFARHAISSECNNQRRSAVPLGKWRVRDKTMVFIQIKLDALDLRVFIILCFRPCSKWLMRRLGGGHHSKILASLSRTLCGSTFLSKFSAHIQGASRSRLSWKVDSWWDLGELSAFQISIKRCYNYMN
jgi:hypothetical protein